MKRNILNINVDDLLFGLLSSFIYVFVFITVPIYALLDKDPYGEGFGFNNMTKPLNAAIIFTIILCVILILNKKKKTGYKMKLKAIFMEILKVVIFTIIIILPVSYLVNRYNTYHRELFDLVTHVEGEGPPYMSPVSARAIVTISIIFFFTTLALRKMGEKVEG